MDTDLFDLKNIDDLPVELRGMVAGHDGKMPLVKIMNLFMQKHELNTKEVAVGLYRKYQLNASSRVVCSALAYLAQKSYINRIGRGQYRITQEALNGRL